ncbi:MAG TPA: Gfo/Idh/MocA family oxidoreductase [Limnochordia bacterium]|nr:Gfo/Idh/MocA family oxidoreductase [Limnochordia bacterium]
MTQPVRLAVVGAGGISQMHLNAARASGGAVQIVALCDVNEALARQRAAEFDIPQVYGDFHAALARPDIDGVVAAVPNFLHDQVAVAALEAGKHVFVEKPLSNTQEGAKRILAAARKAQKVVQVGMIHRFSPGPQALKRAIVAGELGRVYFAQARYLRRKGIPGWGSWFTTHKLSGGGPLIDIGVHALDLCWYLIGKPKPLTVSGVTYAEFGPQKKGIGNWGTPNWQGVYDVEDFSTALIRFEGGASLLLQASWAGHLLPSQDVLIMGAEQGALVTDDKVRLLTERDNQTSERELRDDEAAPGNVRQLLNFAAAVRGQEAPRTPVEDGYAVVAMLTAIYRSAESGREVAVEL